MSATANTKKNNQMKKIIPISIDDLWMERYKLNEQCEQGVDELFRIGGGDKLAVYGEVGESFDKLVE